MRILFITATRIGDAVLSTGILDELGRRHHHAEITVACGPLAASLFHGYPGVVQVIAMPKRRYGGHWWALWLQVKSVSWDLVVDLRRSLIPFLVSAKDRRTLPRTDRRRHRADFLPSVLGIAHGLNPVVYVPADGDRVAGIALGAAGNVLAIAPVAARPDKTWPLARFAELARRVCAPGGPCAGWTVAVIVGPGEDAVTEQFRALIPGLNMVAVADQPDLLRVAAILKRCRLFIGNDSGIAHLAAAVGTPTLALFGPTDPGQYAPRGPHVRVARAATAAILDLTVDTAAAELSALAFAALSR